MPKKLACMPNSPQQGLQFGALSGLGMQTPLRMQVCPMSVATPDCGCSRPPTMHTQVAMPRPALDAI